MLGKTSVQLQTLVLRRLTDMDSWLNISQSLEERELAGKLDELELLQGQLSERELELATLQAALNAFDQEYQRRVGVRRQQLHQIETQIRQYTAYLESVKEFKPSPQLKQLYREVAKRIHPDLAVDENERGHRQQLMIQANQAYEAGDERRLRVILDTWNQSPESVQGEGIPSQLLRTTRKITQIKERLHIIHREITSLENSDTYKLKCRVEYSQQEGQDLLAELAALMEAEIMDAMQQLEHLKAQLSQRV
ncbi:MAG: molecular chaperone DnaJ [Cyanobacteriota bacterium]|nr:molecular chaperone DnaJ [Cyanobacteriota bacterium]